MQHTPTGCGNNLLAGWWLPVVAPQPTSYGVVDIALVIRGVHLLFGGLCNLLYMFPTEPFKGLC